MIPSLTTFKDGQDSDQDLPALAHLFHSLLLHDLLLHNQSVLALLLHQLIRMPTMRVSLLFILKKKSRVPSNGFRIVLV